MVHGHVSSLLAPPMPESSLIQVSLPGPASPTTRLLATFIDPLQVTVEQLVAQLLREEGDSIRRAVCGPDQAAAGDFDASQWAIQRCITSPSGVERTELELDELEERAYEIRRKAQTAPADRL